jgi:hypothetical protein
MHIDIDTAVMDLYKVFMCTFMHIYRNDYIYLCVYIYLETNQYYTCMNICTYMYMLRIFDMDTAVMDLYKVDVFIYV